MTALTRWWDESRVLTRGTFGAWRALLPILLLLQVLSWFSYQAAMAIAALLSPNHPWISLAVFSVGFVTSLAVTVVMMRKVGDHLGSSGMVPDAEGTQDGAGNPDLTRMLALTMLPLLAINAAFGYVADATSELTLLSFTFYGSLGDNILSMLSPTRAGIVTVLAVLLGAYVVRRVLGFIHERTEWRVFGLLVTVTEAFFVMGLVLAASRWFSDAQFWLSKRAFVAWWDSAIAGLSTAVAGIRIDLPEFLQWIVPLWQDVWWPAIVQAVTEPLAWLAVAALIFGSHVVSVAELWRKGQPIASYVPGARRLALVRKMEVSARAKEAQGRGPGVGRRVGLWVQETLFGDIDDKYMPTFHALRLVLRAGIPFLAAFVLLYNLTAVAKELLVSLLMNVIGGHDVLFWTGALPGLDLVSSLLLETLRVALLAVAFHRCLQLFRSHAHRSDNPIPAPMPRGRLFDGAKLGWRKVRGGVAILLVAFVLSTVAWVFSNTVDQQREDHARGDINQTVPIGPMRLTVEDVNYGRVIQDTGGSYVTPAQWVVVSAHLEAPDRAAPLRAELRAGSRTYSSDAFIVTVDDGTWHRQDFLFEIDPADIGDLEFAMTLHSETYVRPAAGLIDLGLPADEADRIRAESQWRIVDFERFPEVGGL